MGRPPPTAAPVGSSTRPFFANYRGVIVRTYHPLSGGTRPDRRPRQSALVPGQSPRTIAGSSLRTYHPLDGGTRPAHCCKQLAMPPDQSSLGPLHSSRPGARHSASLRKLLRGHFADIPFPRWRDSPGPLLQAVGHAACPVITGHRCGTIRSVEGPARPTATGIRPSARPVLANYCGPSLADPSARWKDSTGSCPSTPSNPRTSR